jgi:hypothetical protein
VAEYLRRLSAPKAVEQEKHNLAPTKQKMTGRRPLLEQLSPKK